MHFILKIDKCINFHQILLILDNFSLFEGYSCKLSFFSKKTTLYYGSFLFRNMASDKFEFETPGFNSPPIMFQLLIWYSRRDNHVKEKRVTRKKYLFRNYGQPLFLQKRLFLYNSYLIMFFFLFTIFKH